MNLSISAAVGIASAMIAVGCYSSPRRALIVTAPIATSLLAAFILRRLKRYNSIDCLNPPPPERFLAAALRGDVAECDHLLTTWENPHLLLGCKTAETNWNSIHLAAGNGHMSLLEFLVEKIHPKHREDVLEAKDANGCTPLVLALCNGHEKAALFLIKHGANVTQKGPRGRNSLHLACLGNMLSVVVEIRTQLTADGFSQQARTRSVSGYTALHGSSMAGSTSITKILLDEKSVAINLPALDGTTALHACCRMGHIDVAMLLLDRGATLIECRFGNTPLHVACAFAQPEIVRLFTVRFAMATLIAQDNDGLHPLHVVCQALSQIGLDGTLNAEKQARILECFRVLVDAGYPLDALDYGDASPLYLLCWCPGEGQLQAIKYLFSFLEKHQRQDEIKHLLSLMAESGWTCLHVVHNMPGPASEAVTAILSSYVPNMLSLNLSTPRDTRNTLYLARRGEHNRISEVTRSEVLRGSFSIDGLAAYLQRVARTGRCPRIVVLCGAGISTSSGIRDFRSSNGIYTDKRVSKAFSLGHFAEHPEDFFAVVRELFMPLMDGSIRPTPAHALLRLFKDKGWLQRVYTQNIDTLEEKSGLDEDEIVLCHGSLRRVVCSGCAKMPDGPGIASFWSTVAAGGVPRCPVCSSVMRPDVVLFGEPLGPRFQECAVVDMPQCDLLLVLGTSLLVYPVAALPSQVSPLCPRALFNKEPSGCFQYVPPCAARGLDGHIPAVRGSAAYRDVFCQGDCDSAAQAMAEALGWGKELAVLLAGPPWDS